MKTQDIHQHADLPFPKSLPQFQRLFPDDAACAAYLEKIRWEHGFVCPKCGQVGEPFRFENRPGILRCKACRRDTGLMAGTVMERSHSALSTWFWAAYLVATDTAGMSAVQFQRQLGLSRYETAFQILHKLRAGMVRPDADLIGEAGGYVEVDETWIGGSTHSGTQGVRTNQTLVAAAVEVRQKDMKPGQRRGGRYAGRLRLQVIPNQRTETLTKFVKGTVNPATMVVTDGCKGYSRLTALGFDHMAAVERGGIDVAEEYLPIVHLIFSNLKSWLRGCHHGVSPKHLQAYLNEFTFRFNRRFYPFNTFRSLLGIGGGNAAPTYAELYSGEWKHPTVSGEQGIRG